MRASAKRNRKKPEPKGRQGSSAQTHSRASNAKRAPHEPRLNPWIFVIGLFALGLLIYSPALSGPFFLDDYDLLESFSTVRVANWGTLMTTGRPLLMLTFIANHKISGFEDSFGFHVVNVLLHCLNALLLWRFMAALLAPGRLDDLIPALARPALVYGVPLLFLTSPVMTESVAYISSRSEILASTFYIAALWLFASPLRERRPWISAFLVVFLFVCSFMSKQDKITLPFAILLLDYFLLARLDWRRMKPSLPTYSLFLVGTIAGFFLVIKPFLFAVSAGFNLPWFEYLLTQFRMYFLYLRLLIVPFGLNADWDIVASQTIGENLSWLALLALLTLVGAAIYLRRREPLISFGILFYLAILAPSTSFYPLLDFAAERRMYLPSIGFFLVLVLMISWIAGASSRAKLGALGGLLLIYSWGTYERSRLWGDDLALWHDTAEKSPEKYRPLTWLGKLYDERGSVQDAAYYWEKAEKLADPGSDDHGFLLSNLGVAHAKQKDYAKAAEYYQRSLEILPEEEVIWANFAVTQIRLGHVKEAWGNFEKALKLNPAQPETYVLRGQEFFQRGAYANAVRDLEAALRMRPEDESVRRNLEAARRRLAQ